MSAARPAQDWAARQLHEAVERLRDDMAKVEFWTDVLGCLAQPIPDYDPGDGKLNQFSLPRDAGGVTRTGGSGRRDDDRRAPKQRPEHSSEEGDSRR